MNKMHLVIFIRDDHIPFGISVHLRGLVSELFYLYKIKQEQPEGVTFHFLIFDASLDLSWKS